MANIIYLTLNGKKQDLISAGCSTFSSIGNKYQSGHEDEIFIYEFFGHLNRADNVSFLPIQIKKPIDKSTPLIAQALNDNETLTCEFSFYRTSTTGGNELYFKIKLLGAIITDISYVYPNSLTDNGEQPHESVHFKFHTIEWEHVVARTNSYLFWKDAAS
ncbi:Hcp family type VI secretion system effector [Dickeya fangzhongdai]|uniref:Hcp family type VI secretion system effector n=1 Tax=Dickeya fangzhongdai TaxID=1778540 RepID=UPI0026DED411|nr:Hcp family type VI secretion system effector [Dickeya fangzhongdai]WKV52693.1 Hcp family type VI secretion system effector [Dickeya fangzhongdai]